MTDLGSLGERTITVDCDAAGGRRHPDGGDHGGYLALALAPGNSPRTAWSSPSPWPRESVAAVSVGIVDGEARLDLSYEEDARRRSTATS